MIYRTMFLIVLLIYLALCFALPQPVLDAWAFIAVPVAVLLLTVLAWKGKLLGS